MVEVWQIVVVIICVLLSGAFSGLTLGLLSLDLVDLAVLVESGTPKEVKCAKRILPVRKHGNFLLCTLLVGNTAVNSALSIVTSDLFGGWAGFLASTLVILYLGEIVPQSVCFSYGLTIGAHAVPFVKLAMLLTSPLSYPTSRLLDWALGGEQAVRYNKSQLKSLVNLHGEQTGRMPTGETMEMARAVMAVLGTAASASAGASRTGRSLKRLRSGAARTRRPSNQRSRRR